MIKTVLTAAGVPHRQGRYINPPAETYAVFFDDVSTDGPDRVPVVAGSKLPKICTHSATVELYEPKPDEAAEAAIEAALDGQGLTWSKQDRYWLENVQRYQVIYETEYITKS